MVKAEPGVRVGGLVTVYYDPPLRPLTPSEIDVLDSYCVGGGVTISCGDPVVRILNPPGEGYYYAELEANEVVANSWVETEEYFGFGVDVGGLMRSPGVYTVVVWRDSGTGRYSERLIELSVFVD